MNVTEAIELLEKIIALPSFSKEERQVADLMVSVLSGYGYRVERKGNNIWVRSLHFDARKPTLVLEELENRSFYARYRRRKVIRFGKQ